MTTPRKEYLGDGCYVDVYGPDVVITTSNGLRDTNRIVLEPEVYAKLEGYVGRWRAEASWSQRIAAWLVALPRSQATAGVRIQEVLIGAIGLVRPVHGDTLRCHSVLAQLGWVRNDTDDGAVYRRREGP